MLKKIFAFLFVLSFFNNNAQIKSSIEDSIAKKIGNAQILSSENPEKAIIVLKELKQEAEKANFKKGMSNISQTLIVIYFNSGDYKKGIEEGRYAEKVAMELGQMEPLSDVYRMRGIAYLEMQFPKEASKELEKALKYAEKIPKPVRRFYTLSLVHEGFASNYAKLGDFKKEIQHRLKSVKASKKMPESKDDPIMIQAKYYSLAYQYAALGLKYNDLKVKDSALFYFEEGLKIHENGKCDVYNDERANLLSGLAVYYVSTKEYKKAIQFAKKAEALEKQVGGLSYVRKRIYDVLFNSYIETEKQDSSKYYLKLYTALNDSIIKVEKENIYAPVNQIILDNEKENTSKVKNIMIVAVIALIIFLATGWFFWRRKNSRIQKNYENLIEKLRYEQSLQLASLEEEVEAADHIEIVNYYAEDEKDKHQAITSSTVSALLSKLEKFERSEKYIKNEVSLTYLASSLQTNTKYLSEIIKQYRGKSYNNYINGLRINYIVRALFEKPKLREYKISHLAELCGFSSREVFATIFKKETGFTPSFYIESLKKDETNLAS